ncbi:Poly [ADP-ribose] polymerase (PARP) [Durusdinium trenchii]|uniref:Poly [ADP-ribose] polymerase (PARP) n=1 Tax=Durusdinium trenchii TaxID=1381693 RepID=A0ABP0RPC9_9DINO
MGQTVAYSQQELDTERSTGLAIFRQQQPILKSFNEKTQVPHIHLRLCSSGYLELCGPDPGGKLESFLKSKWQADDAVLVGRRVMPSGACCWQTRGEANLPRETMDYTCDKHLVFGKQLTDGSVQGNGVFHSQGWQGESNMAKLTLSLINFMNELHCELLSCSMENLETRFRESQLTFRAPHEKSTLGPFMMVTMRQTGYIELVGANAEGILDQLSKYVQQALGCSRLEANEIFCDRKFQATFAFPSHAVSSSGDNNMGRGAAGIINFMAQTCGWSLVSHTESDRGQDGQGRERNMLFRRDSLGFHAHVIVELRNAGRIYLNGAKEGLREAEGYFLKRGCQACSPENLCDAQYVGAAGFFVVDEANNTNLGRRTVEVTEWMSGKGWVLRSCSGMQHNHQCGAKRHEQHLVFARPKQRNQAPSPTSTLAVEFRVLPQSIKRDYTCVVQISGQNTNGVYEKLLSHLTEIMLCENVGPQGFCDLLLASNALRVTGLNLHGESNFGKFSSILCDFMVDHLKQWALVSNVGQSGSKRWNVSEGQTPHYVTLLARQQLFIFCSDSPAPLQEKMSTL